VDFQLGGGMPILFLVSILIVVLFWGLVIAAIVLAIRWLIRADRRGAHEGPATPDALELLANATPAARSTRPSTSAGRPS
jgi:hypothetical protein